MRLAQAGRTFSSKRTYTPEAQPWGIRGGEEGDLVNSGVLGDSTSREGTRKFNKRALGSETLDQLRKTLITREEANLQIEPLFAGEGKVLADLLNKTSPHLKKG